MNAKAIPTVKKVTTVRGGQVIQQSHRGFTGIVYLPGERRPFRTRTFHQKRGAAVAAAEKLGRYLVKNPDERDEYRSR